MSGDADGAKQTAESAIDAALDSLIRLSHTIHAHPELSYEEEQAAGWTAGALSDGGFTVTEGVGNLPTAFSA